MEGSRKGGGRRVREVKRGSGWKAGQEDRRGPGGMKGKLEKARRRKGGLERLGCRDRSWEELGWLKKESAEGRINRGEPSPGWGWSQKWLLLFHN